MLYVTTSSATTPGERQYGGYQVLFLHFYHTISIHRTTKISSASNVWAGCKDRQVTAKNQETIPACYASPMLPKPSSTVQPLLPFERRQKPRMTTQKV
ncbi:hypothetical protein B0T14DRAFT_269017 [Immersiella caudata]|uniref:Uncharacterized protein n=1 Tax=Immersiella caudata TaxID=314043 RepID=A0AA39WL47_9PEZI|nr:hypothetical protein B0T14DRAFT_269017 [Immersiella caudata]